MPWFSNRRVKNAYSGYQKDYSFKFKHSVIEISEIKGGSMLTKNYLFCVILEVADF